MKISEPFRFTGHADFGRSPTVNRVLTKKLIFRLHGARTIISIFGNSSDATESPESLARACEAPHVNVGTLTTYAGYLPIASHHERAMPLAPQ